MCADTLAQLNRSKECHEPRSFARRGGIAKRGDGSPSTTPTYHEKEAEFSYLQSEILHENKEEVYIKPYAPSPPLSPKTTVARPKAQRRQCVERKRNHPYEQPSSNRRPSWRPNLKLEFLRCGSIDSIITPFNEAGWFEPGCGVRPRRRRSSAMTTGARSDSICSDMDGPKARRESTLLHPSSPGIESAASIDPFDAARTFKITHQWDQLVVHASLRPLMPPRKGSSLLRPSSPASDDSECFELKTVMSLPPRLLWGEDRSR